MKNDIHDLGLVLDSKVKLILIESWDEPRVLETLTGLAVKRGLGLHTWSVTEGLQRLGFGGEALGEGATQEPEAALRLIKADPQANLYVLCDLHPFLADNPRLVRLLKEIAMRDTPHAPTLVLVSHACKLPAEVQRFSARFSLALPSEDELLAIVREEAGRWSERNRNARVRTDNRTLQQVVKNLRGLSHAEARALARNVICDDGAITQEDLPELNKTKFQLLDLEGVLSFEYDTARFAEVGGLSNLKRWLAERQGFFLDGKGVDLPKGVLLVGVQGGGKSLAAKARGNDTIDFVGPGEPSIVPHIAELIAFAKENGIRTCMITHGIIGSTRLAEIFDAGLDDFLISMHGMDATHNSMVGEIKGARAAQEKTIRAIKERGKTYRVNFVINSHNFREIREFSEYLVGLPLRPRIINFINFNPHGEWSGNMRSKDFTADLRQVEPLLDAAIDVLEGAGIGVNVRYYPMCRLAETHRKNVCNDLHVMFDPYEWDYSVLPKTAEHYRSYGIYISRTIEEQSGPCIRCDLKGICGGINRQYNVMTDGQLIDSIKLPALAGSNDFYHYRRENTAVFQW